MEDIIKMLDLIGNKEVLNKIADMSWNLYQSLKDKGFSEEQALLLTNAISSKK